MSHEARFHPVLPSDVELIVALVNAHSQATVGTQRATLDADGDVRLTCYIPGAAEQLIVRDTNGQPMAHAFCLSRPPHVVAELGCIVHPDHWDEAVGQMLLDHLEAMARRSLSRAPDEARVVAQMTVLGDDSFMRGTLKAHN